MDLYPRDRFTPPRETDRDRGPPDEPGTGAGINPLLIKLRTANAFSEKLLDKRRQDAPGPPVPSARSPRCVWCGEGWGEGGGGGGFYFFPLFLKRMTATKFSPLDPLFRCTPPAHPASGLRTLSPPPAPARRRWRRPPPPRSRRAPAPGDDGRAGGEGPAPGTFAGSGGGGGSAGKPRAAGGSAAGGGGGGEEGGGRGAGGVGAGLLLHSL